MPVDFDTDAGNSALEMGIELEYPKKADGEKFVHRGSGSDDLRHRMGAAAGRSDAQVTYDGTVGLEVVSDVLHLDDAPQWYADVLEYIREEYNERYQPTGLMDTGSTAGLHIHLSSLSSDQARQLYELSQEPWVQVLFCTSIAMNNDGQPSWPVFRGGSYCRMDYDNERYSVVNSRGHGHYEWRLPEPMTRENLEVLVEFLRAFEQSPEAARQYGQRILDEADERITSIKRAESVGMDIEEIPVVVREQHPEDPLDFFEQIRNDWAMPEIHQVEFAGRSYYVFSTEMEAEWTVEGVTFSPDDVLVADELEPLDPESELAEEIRRAFEVRDRGDGPTRETEATHELKEIVKKKKS